MDGAPQDASKEAYAQLENGIPDGGSLGVEGAIAEAPLEVATTSSFSTRLTSIGPRRPRMLDWLLLSSYVSPQEWIHPSVYMVALGLEGAREIIDHYSPFNKRESSVMKMHDLYPTVLWVPMAAHAEQYSIPFTNYLDRETFQHVAEDGMLVRNHDFH